jgi:hypothetical protein
LPNQSLSFNPTNKRSTWVQSLHQYREQIEEIARGIAAESGELPEGNDLQTVLDAAAGLTRYEAEAAFSLSSTQNWGVAATCVYV